ncbi:glutamate ABC transporter substrate-binding protein [Streptomyces sp. P17]|uniref:glutamate ABC transporter substrate-binding protein n=1 Tax=Streptomyces sp. P17 TaxID=3074716 RepID=UPI0028F45D4B|nr:glutamate ABC transporter substrate-binding protein [Streptomyces sp. P17]MDT9697951.1 glutamate ABC transporter substrate-binding protein [Streptomyces sp. P17]
MRTSRIISALTATTALALVATACGGGSTASSKSAPQPVSAPSFAPGTTMADIVKAGKLRVGVKFDHPLLSQKNLKGDLEGFEADTIRYIAAQLGLKSDQIEFVETSGTNREQFIEQHKVDMVVATMSITDERKRVIGFAGPYLSVRQDLLVKKGNPEGLKDPQTPAGKKICSTLGGAVSQVTREQYPKAKLVEFDVSSKCVEALKNNSVDALATQDLIGASYVAQDPDSFQMLNKPYGAEKWGVGIRKGDKAFCEFIDGALDKFAKDGSFKKAWDNSLGKFVGTEQKLPEPEPCS